VGGAFSGFWKYLPALSLECPRVGRGYTTKDRTKKGYTIHNPSFATTPLSPCKIKKVPPKLINFTYTKVSLNI
jgi:hypothetical protein